MHRKFWQENLKEREHLEYVVGWIILKRILKEYDERYGNDSCGSGRGDDNNEYLDSLRCPEFLD
jgi:hypothetical protein